MLSGGVAMASDAVDLSGIENRLNILEGYWAKDENGDIYAKDGVGVYTEGFITAGKPNGDKVSFSAGWGVSDGQQYTDLWVVDEEDSRRLSLHGHVHDERYYTQAQVNSLLASVHGMSLKYVAKLPTASEQTLGNIYLLDKGGSDIYDTKDEYITIDNGSGGYGWERIGSTAVDLSGYLKAADSYVNGKTVTIGGMSVTVPTIYGLKLQAGSFAEVTYNPDSRAETVRIPTMTSHLTNNSGFAYTKDLNGYVTLETAQTIKGEKTFDKTIYINSRDSVVIPENGSFSVRLDGKNESLFRHHHGEDGFKAVLFGEGVRDHEYNFYGAQINFYDGPNNKNIFFINGGSINARRSVFPAFWEPGEWIALGGNNNRWSAIYGAELDITGLRVTPSGVYLDSRELYTQMYHPFYDKDGEGVARSMITSWGEKAMCINLNSKARQRALHLCGKLVNFFTDDDTQYEKRVAYIDENGLYAKRFYPMGGEGAYIEFDVNQKAFKVSGNMYVTGFLTSGAFGVNGNGMSDIKTDIPFSIIPTSSNMFDLGNGSYRFKTLYAVGANFSGDVSCSKKIESDTISAKTLVSAPEGNFAKITGGDITLNALESYLPANVGGTNTADLSSAIFTSANITGIVNGTIRVIKTANYMLNVNGWRKNGTRYEIYAGGFTFVQGTANWTITKN